MKKAAIISVVILLFSPACGLAALIWSDNLLTNPGAETGELAPWIDGSHTIVSQSQGEHTGPVYPHSGDWFFNMAGARAGDAGELVIETLYQDVDVSSYTPAIDAGMLLVRANTWLHTEDSPDHAYADYAELSVCFLNESGAEIDTLATGLVQSPNDIWLERILEGTVPLGTRALRLELSGIKREGGWINAFFDDAGVKVAEVPEPATLCLLSLAGLQFLRKRKF